MDAFNVPIPVAATKMQKHQDFVREGLKQGVFPFGYAVKTSGKYSYYISSVKFYECTGIKVEKDEII